MSTNTKPAPETLSEVMGCAYRLSAYTGKPPTYEMWERLQKAAQRLEARNRHLQEQIDDLYHRLGVPCPEGM